MKPFNPEAYAFKTPEVTENFRKFFIESQQGEPVANIQAVFDAFVKCDTEMYRKRMLETTMNPEQEEEREKIINNLEFTD
jgi:hypothetical protein